MWDGDPSGGHTRLQALAISRGVLCILLFYYFMHQILCVCFFLSSSTNFNTVHFIEMEKMTVVCYSRAIEHRP